MQATFHKAKVNKGTSFVAADCAEGRLRVRFPASGMPVRTPNKSRIVTSEYTLRVYVSVNAAATP